MRNYYFTYGTDTSLPFCGGYTKVIARNMSEAVQMFNSRHPCRHHSVVNCSYILYEDEFKLFYKNSDAECHEVICY